MADAVGTEIDDFAHVGEGDAGLWEKWTDKASGETIRSCTIITTEPNKLCAPIHTHRSIRLAWTHRNVCSYYVLMYDERDPRTIRLFDLRPFEAIAVRCSCGHITEYPEGLLQRQYRLPSDTLIYDLQFRLRCEHCNKRREFRIAILDRRTVTNSFSPRIERVIVDRNSETT